MGAAFSARMLLLLLLFPSLALPAEVLTQREAEARVEDLTAKMARICGRPFPRPLTLTLLPRAAHGERWKAVLRGSGWADLGRSSAENLRFLGFPVPGPDQGAWWRWERAPEAFWDPGARTLVVLREPQDDPRVGEWVWVSALRAAWQDLAGWPRRPVSWPSHQGLLRDLLQWGDRLLMLVVFGERHTAWPCAREAWADEQDREAMLSLLPCPDWPRARAGMTLVRERLEWPFPAGLSCLLPFADHPERWGRWQDLWSAEGGGWAGPAGKRFFPSGAVPDLQALGRGHGVMRQQERMGPWWLGHWLGMPLLGSPHLKGDAYALWIRGAQKTAMGEVWWQKEELCRTACAALEGAWSERLGMVCRSGGKGDAVRAGEGAGRYGLIEGRGKGMRWLLTEDREVANRWMAHGTLWAGAPGIPEERNGDQGEGSGCGHVKLTIPDVEDNTVSEGT